MKRLYHQGVLGKTIMVLSLIISTFGLFVAISKGNLKDSIILILCNLAVLYGILGVFMARVLLTEQGIRVESGGLAAPRELQWEEIGRVVDDSFLGLHVYHIIPQSHGKRRIMIPWSVANHKELLAEVIQRAPQAIVDESINMLVR